MAQAVSARETVASASRFDWLTALSGSTSLTTLSPSNGPVEQTSSLARKKFRHSPADLSAEALIVRVTRTIAG